MTASLSPICWVCGKRLGSAHPRPGEHCAVVRDPLGHEHRVHLICLKDVVDVPAVKFVRNELVDITERTVT